MPNDIANALYIVQKGTIAVTGRGHNHVSDLKFVQQGGSFGNETLYCKPHEKREHSAFSVSSCVLLHLARKNLHDAIENHCDVRYRVRIKGVITLRRVFRAVQDATAHVVHTLNVNEALQLLVKDLGCSSDVVMSRECVLIENWSKKCIDAVSRAGENARYVIRYFLGFSFFFFF